MTLSKTYEKRKKLRGGRKKSRRRKRRKTMRGGGCACAESMTGGRRRRKRRKRKTKRRKNRRRRRTRRRSRRMRGGGALQGSCVNWNCDVPSNIGETFTGYKYNTNPYLPDPKSLNSNIKIKPKMKMQKGGGLPALMEDFGLGDLLLGYWKGSNAVANTKYRYTGAKPKVGADPMNQPALMKNLPLPYATPNVPQFYDTASNQAAENTISAGTSSGKAS